jgi:glyoxylase-like metal-dependent hydrolase (beta-lactamase superfamily II)
MAAKNIDLMHLGNDRVIGTWERDGVIVDPGPESCIETLLDGLEGPPRTLLLTHIHLDHAGASGALVERFPELTVYVHERGARHMVDPSRLLKSAGMLYGDDMQRLWGEVVPVPEERIVSLAGGEVVEGMRVEKARGHANHHVIYLDQDSGECFTGDTAGVRVPPLEQVFAPTPPPDIDVEAWFESISLIESMAPSRLCLTHFGPIEGDAVAGHLAELREWLGRAAAASEDLDREKFDAWLFDWLDRSGDPAISERLRQAMPPDQAWLGLERHWKQRREREAEASATE